MLKELVIAFQSWADAHRFIQERRTWKWILLPGIIYTLLFIFGMIVFWRSADSAVSWASAQLRIEPWLQQKRSEWLSFFFVMTGVMLRLILFLFYFSLFKYLILIIGSPVFAYLSEKTEATLEDKEHSFNWAELKKRLPEKYSTCSTQRGVANHIHFWIIASLTCTPDWLDNSIDSLGYGVLLFWIFHA